MGRKSKKKDVVLPGVDVPLSLYELTDLFYEFYRYQNETSAISYNQYSLESRENGVLRTKVVQQTLPRFAVFRRIESCRLGSRPFSADTKVALTRPNVSLGYLRYFLKYLKLPFQSFFTEGDIVKVNISKQLFDQEKYSDKEQEQIAQQAKNNPTISSSGEISNDTSQAFIKCLNVSQKFQKCVEQIPLHVARDAVAFLLHSDVKWDPEPVDPLDVVTEPFADWDPSTWGSFFIIRKIPVSEIVHHIRKNTPFWRPDALRWALEEASRSGGLLSKHYSGFIGDDSSVAGENFMVKSYSGEKNYRLQNIGSYYGYMMAVESYTYNANGKVDKTIFFPSQLFHKTSQEIRERREAYVTGKLKDLKNIDDDLLHCEHADVLFHRTDVFADICEAITVIPFEREEKSLERQRGYGHELFSPLELVARLDSSILNIANLMGIPMYKDLNQGGDAQKAEDLEIQSSGEMNDIGNRTIIATPWNVDLNAMIAVQSKLLQHVFSIAFIGGIDGTEFRGNAQGLNLASLRLVRDARIHKATTEDFAKGIQEALSKTFRRILDLKRRQLSDPLLKKLFFEYVLNLLGHPEEVYDFTKADILEDTGLPYWMSVEAVRNSGSSFGAAEMILYAEVKQAFGDGLTQKGMTELNRRAIKEILGRDAALDILGNPKDNMVGEQDQVYRARLENASILGAVDQTTVNFEEVSILPDKDDHLTHLQQVHNPKAKEILELLQTAQVSPEQLQTLSEDQLQTRTNLILKLGALTNHMAQHLDILMQFGGKRGDVAQLREETNMLLQAGEGLMNSLEINLRRLTELRNEKEMKLRNMTPENEAEKFKQQVELEKLQAQREKDSNSLALANKIADMKQQQHIDKQVSKARDRDLKRAALDRDAYIKESDLNIKSKDVDGKNEERRSKSVAVQAEAIKGSFEGGEVVS